MDYLFTGISEYGYLRSAFRQLLAESFTRLCAGLILDYPYILDLTTRFW